MSDPKRVTVARARVAKFLKIDPVEGNGIERAPPQVSYCEPVILLRNCIFLYIRCFSIVRGGSRPCTCALTAHIPVVFPSFSFDCEGARFVFSKFDFVCACRHADEEFDDEISESKSVVPHPLFADAKMDPYHESTKRSAAF